MNGHRQLKLMLQYDFYSVLGCLEVGQVGNLGERSQNFMKSDPNSQLVLALILPEFLHMTIDS